MKVSALYIYPVKSCAGLSISTSTLLPRGLRNDRRFMLVNPEGDMVTQRAEPRLARVSTSIGTDGASFVLSTEEGEARVPFGHTDEDGPAGALAPAATIKVKVWKDVVDAELASEQASALVSSWLSQPVRLVRMPVTTQRVVDQKYAAPHDRVSFADGFPVLVANDASLRDLNGRMKAPVGMDRFRPNVVVDGLPPFAEEELGTLALGQAARLGLVKPCSRCSVVTVDQRTAERGKEPLATLATYRLRENETYFAMNALVRACGELRVGDAVAFTPGT
jgi:hypothetical protein